MTTNPFINALAASLYITLIVNGISYLEVIDTGEDTILAPIAMLSLFTLSAAVMGYLFVYQPLSLFLEGQKSRAATFFLQTVGSFALITAIIFISMITAVRV